MDPKKKKKSEREKDTRTFQQSAFNTEGYLASHHATFLKEHSKQTGMHHFSKAGTIHIARSFYHYMNTKACTPTIKITAGPLDNIISWDHCGICGLLWIKTLRCDKKYTYTAPSDFFLTNKSNSNEKIHTFHRTENTVQNFPLI